MRDAAAWLLIYRRRGGESKFGCTWGTMGQALLYGIHDPGGEHLLPTGSTIVFTEGIGCNPDDDMSGGDYRRWEQQGYQVIVRLNNGYGADGTIPTPDKYADFAPVRQLHSQQSGMHTLDHWQ